MNMGGEYHLPEPLIQLIQSFLTAKEAARTTALSKSWGGAWLTRPNLEFDRSDFPCRPRQFGQFADETLKRYEDSNLKVESFGILTDEIRCDELSMIARAFKIGPTRLTVESQNDGKYITLPGEAVFGGSENLVSLTLKGCTISLREQDVLVRCSKLKSLCLHNVCIPSTGGISRVISSCPLIESLSLSNIYDNCHDVLIDVLPRLTSLVLTSVYFDASFMSVDISTTFPSLKDLTLSGQITCQEDMLISSRSLERIDFALPVGYYGYTPRFTFDVPNIRKFTYRGWLYPNLSFRSTPKGLEECRVYIKHPECLGTSWYRRLGKFLEMLRRSRIYLFLDFAHGSSFPLKPGGIRFPASAIEMENLTIDFENADQYLSNCCAHELDVLFRMCRPKLITRSAPSKTSCFRRKKQHDELLRMASFLKRLTRDVETTLTPTQCMHGLNDLEETRAQIFDENVSMWRDVSLDALSSEDSRKVRFQLKWRKRN